MRAAASRLDRLPRKYRRVRTDISRRGGSPNSFLRSSHRRPIKILQLTESFPSLFHAGRESVSFLLSRSLTVPRRWMMSETVTRVDGDTYNTQFTVAARRLCLFSRKNRSFVTGAPIYIGSPQRLHAVTNAPGPRIPSPVYAVSVAYIRSRFASFPLAKLTRIGLFRILIGNERLTLFTFGNNHRSPRLDFGRMSVFVSLAMTRALNDGMVRVPVFGMKTTHSHVSFYVVLQAQLPIKYVLGKCYSRNIFCFIGYRKYSEKRLHLSITSIYHRIRKSSYSILRYLLRSSPKLYEPKGFTLKGNCLSSLIRLQIQPRKKISVYFPPYRTTASNARRVQDKHEHELIQALTTRARRQYLSSGVSPDIKISSRDESPDEVPAEPRNPRFSSRNLLSVDSFLCAREIYSPTDVPSETTNHPFPYHARTSRRNHGRSRLSSRRFSRTTPLFPVAIIFPLRVS